MFVLKFANVNSSPKKVFCNTVLYSNQTKYYSISRNNTFISYANTLFSLAVADGTSKGIKFIEPNENLAKEYEQTADETLEILRAIQNKSKVWLATTKYYCEYFSLYSLLMKIGIKCEIHDCTLMLCGFLEEENILPKGYTQILQQDKQLRIDNQYYLKNKTSPFYIAASSLPLCFQR